MQPSHLPYKLQDNHNKIMIRLYAVGFFFWFFGVFFGLLLAFTQAKNISDFHRLKVFLDYSVKTVQSSCTYFIMKNVYYTFQILNWLTPLQSLGSCKYTLKTEALGKSENGHSSV